MPTITTYTCDICGKSSDNRDEFSYIVVEMWERVLPGGRAYVLLCLPECFEEKVRQLRNIGFELGA